MNEKKKLKLLESDVGSARCLRLLVPIGVSGCLIEVSELAYPLPKNFLVGGVEVSGGGC